MNTKEQLIRLPQDLYLFYFVLLFVLSSCTNLKPGEQDLLATLEAPRESVCTVDDPERPELQDYRFSPDDYFIDYANICALEKKGFTPEHLRFIRERIFYTEFYNSEGAISHCTSFLVQQTPDGAVLATNRHCNIEAGSSVLLARPGVDQHFTRVKVLGKRVHPEADLSTILVPRSSSLPINLTPLSISAYSPEVGDAFLTVGFPSVTISRNAISMQIITRSSSPELIASGISGRGSSGSPGIMLLENGVPSNNGAPHVVGVVWGAPSSKGDLFDPDAAFIRRYGGRLVYFEPAIVLTDLLFDSVIYPDE